MYYSFRIEYFFTFLACRASAPFKLQIVSQGWPAAKKQKDLNQMRKIMIMLLFAISTLAVSAVVNADPPADQDPPPDCAPTCLVAR